MTIAEQKLQAFKFNATDKTIRVEMVNNEPYFIAKDLCEALDLSDTSKSLEKLDDDEKLIRKLFVSGQNREVWLVNESGLYNLIFRSNKPEAKAFRKWVTAEVLPTIRQTGVYQPAKTQVPVLTNAQKRRSNYVDLRDTAYDTVEVNSKQVRHIIYNDADWYNILDVCQAIGTTTETAQIANKLNAKKTLAEKFFIYGATHPGWFCRSSGLTLILAGSRMLKNAQLRIVLPINKDVERRAAI